VPFTLINQNLNKISRGFQIKESKVFGPERISKPAGMNQ